MLKHTKREVKSCLFLPGFMRFFLQFITGVCENSLISLTFFPLHYNFYNVSALKRDEKSIYLDLRVSWYYVNRAGKDHSKCRLVIGKV